MENLMAVLLISLLLSSFQSFAIEPQPALPLRVSVEKDVNAEFGQRLTGILQVALNFVRVYPPDGYEDNLFVWSKDRQILNGKSFQIYLTTSKNPTFAPLLKNAGALNMDAFTAAPMNLTKKEMPILLVLLVDRIFYNKSGHENRDGFSRLVLALAHEIYGNVQHFLQFRIETAQPQTVADRVMQERNAFRASLMFLGKLRDSPDFATMPGSVQEGLLNLIPLELKAYRSWQRANPYYGLDPACEAMVKSLNDHVKEGGS